MHLGLTWGKLTRLNGTISCNIPSRLLHSICVCSMQVCLCNFDTDVLQVCFRWFIYTVSRTSKPVYVVSQNSQDPEWISCACAKFC